MEPHDTIITYITVEATALGCELSVRQPFPEGCNQISIDYSRVFFSLLRSSSRPLSSPETSVTTKPHGVICQEVLKFSTRIIFYISQK